MRDLIFPFQIINRHRVRVDGLLLSNCDATFIVLRVSKPRGVVMTSLAFNPVVVVAGSVTVVKQSRRLVVNSPLIASGGLRPRCRSSWVQMHCYTRPLSRNHRTIAWHRLEAMVAPEIRSLHVNVLYLRSSKI